MAKAKAKAKVFMSGGSQAVRLPADFRFDTDEVDVRRDPATGNVILSKPLASWDDYFTWAATLELPDDFLRERDQPADDAGHPFGQVAAGSAMKRSKRGVDR